MKAGVIVAALCLAAGVTPQTQGSIPAALDRYSAGDFDAAVRSLPLNTLTVETVTADADLWIAGGGPVAHNHRTYIAAAFALELLAATSPSRLRFSGGASYTSPGGRTPIATFGAPLKMIAWACGRLRALRDPPPGVRWWWLSSVALLQQMNDSSTLMGWTKIMKWEDVSPEMRALIEAEIADGHLAHAREHVPNEPRLTLAAALAEVAKADRGFYDRSSRADVLRSLELWQKQHGTGGSDDIERALSALVTDPQLGAEAEVRLGFFDLRRQRWQPALAHFVRARPRVDEPILQAGIEYFSGWIYERTNRTPDAIAAYRRANAIVPHLRNVSMLLSAQLFEANQRDEAYSILDGLARTKTLPSDPVVVLREGDARFLPDWMLKLREALR